MKKTDKGFTLSEVLICLAIVAFILMVAVPSINITRVSYTSLAYFEMKNLQDTAGVLYSGKTMICGNVATYTTETGDEFDLCASAAATSEPIMDNSGNYLASMVAPCKRSDGLTISVLRNDGGYGYCGYKTSSSCDSSSCDANAYNGDSQFENLFCKSMAAISDTSGTIDCSNLASVDFSGSEPYITDFSIDSPNFIAANGRRYYISKWVFNTSVSDKYGFRLVAVDLNGTKGPNITDNDTSSGKLPDIVTFMVLDNGEVLPLGAAADNKIIGNRTFQYINAKVKGYYYSYYNSEGERFERDTTPSDCVAYSTDSSGTSQKYDTCNYGVVLLEDEDNDNSSGNSFFSYRNAYCAALGGNTGVYENYCSGKSASRYCPPSSENNAFDLCTVYMVKPMFRYNFSN